MTRYRVGVCGHFSPDHGKEILILVVKLRDDKLDADLFSKQSIEFFEEGLKEKFGMERFDPRFRAQLLDFLRRSFPTQKMRQSAHDRRPPHNRAFTPTLRRPHFARTR